MFAALTSVAEVVVVVVVVVVVDDDAEVVAVDGVAGGDKFAEDSEVRVVVALQESAHVVARPGAGSVVAVGSFVIELSGLVVADSFGIDLNPVVADSFGIDLTFAAEWAVAD